MIVLMRSGFGITFSVMIAWPAAAWAQNKSVVDDVPIIRKNLNDALDHLPDGGTMTWQNPANGHNGTITADQTTPDTSDGRPCRNFRRTWTFNSGTSRFRGLACKDPVGLWRVQNEQNLGRVNAVASNAVGATRGGAGQSSASATSSAPSSPSASQQTVSAANTTQTPTQPASPTSTQVSSVATEEQGLGKVPDKSVIR